MRKGFSYTLVQCVNRRMRKPSPVELEATILLFVLMVPTGYYMVRTVLAFVGL